MRRKPATFDAHKSLRPLRPSSSASKLSSSRPIEERPAWDSTVSDLSVHKLTRAQQLNRKASVISKNRSKARQEWLHRQQKLAENPEAEKEMIAKLKPPRKPKPEPKPISYPFYHQRRLYERDQNGGGTSPQRMRGQNEDPNNEVTERPRLRSGAAGQIKFTPAVITPQKKMEREQQIEAMELCAALNGGKSKESSAQKQEMDKEMERFKAKYLTEEEPQQPKSDYLDFSQNLKNLEKLKQELSLPYGSGATPDPTPLDPLLQKYGLSLNQEQDGVLSLIPSIKRDPIPQTGGLSYGRMEPNPLTNNALMAQPEPAQSSTQTWGMNPFTEAQNTVKPNRAPLQEVKSYGYDAYIPEPKCLGEVEGPSERADPIDVQGGGLFVTRGNGVRFEPSLNIQSRESEEAKLESMKDLFFGVQKQLEKMNVGGGMSGLQWSDGDAQNKVKIDVMGNVGQMDPMFADDDCPEEPRMYAVQQFAPLGDRESRPHLAGAPESSLSVRSHMMQFY